MKNVEHQIKKDETTREIRMTAFVQNNIITGAKTFIIENNCSV